jgi:uncharacterized protein YbbK (DUF523 family)
MPVCPEVEIGLGTSGNGQDRADGGVDHLVQPATGRDVGAEMSGFALRFLGLPPVDGFILKGGSPISGTSGVRVYPSAERYTSLQGFQGILWTFSSYLSIANFRLRPGAFM